MKVFGKKNHALEYILSPTSNMRDMKKKNIFTYKKTGHFLTCSFLLSYTKMFPFGSAGLIRARIATTTPIMHGIPVQKNRTQAIAFPIFPE